MKAVSRLFVLLSAVCMFASCASYRVRVDKPYRNWESQPLPDKELDFKVFLIGSADGTSSASNPVLEQLQTELKQAPDSSAVVFLGNSSAFLEKSKGGKLGDSPLLTTLKSYRGKTYFLPGDKDWASGGVKKVRSLEKQVEEYLGKEVFFPDEACGGPESEDLTEKLGLILLDSEWFLHDWDEQPSINEDCDIFTRSMFEEELKGEVDDLQGKNMLIVAHHPIQSEGRGAGHYSLKEHIFPFTISGKNNYIPLPIIGTAAISIGNAVSTRQELNHPIYQDYIGTVENALGKKSNAVFVAAHENNQQLIMDKDYVHILTGGGTERFPVKLGKHTPMVAGKPGYTVITYYEDGEAWVEFIEAPKKKKQSSGNDGNVIYRQKILDPLPTTEELTPATFPQYDLGADSVNVSIFDKGDIWDLGDFFWGKLWTDYYFIDIKMPVLDLEDFQGGLTAIEQGGGFQTKSIRLVSDSGPRRLYQIRGLQKSADKLFYPLNRTFARRILEHQFTANNPFGAFMLQPMQNAIGIYHTNPMLVYVPKQPRLNRFNNLGGSVYMLEERPDEDWRNLPSFGNSSDIVSTRKVVEERMESDDGVIDQAMVLRCRLFDMVVGDWDRHDDQWRWASFPIEGSDRTLYQPIPRDRDQVFSKFGGLMFHAGRLMFPFLRASHTYDDKIKKKEVRWLNYQARDFDAFFLNETDWPEWQRQVNHLQQTLTDEVIEQGIRWLPDTVYQSMGPFLVKSLKARRDNLMETAQRYYRYLNKEVSVVATKKENHILVERLSDGHTRVSIYEYKDDKASKEKIYQRLFDNNITKEIRIFGLEGDDEFEIKGETRKSPLVRLIGGVGEDRLTDESAVEGLSRKTKFYDSASEESKLEDSDETEDQRNTVVEENMFMFHHVNYNYTTYLPNLGYNPDDGVYFGGEVTMYRYGYRTDQVHRLSGQFQTATRGFVLHYMGEFNHILGRKGIRLGADIEDPRYVTNFFGLGNETVKLDTDRDFYRVRRRRFNLSTALHTETKGGLSFEAGPVIEAMKIDSLDNHFLTGENRDIRPEVFDFQYFGGVRAEVSYRIVERTFKPRQGVVFRAGGGWQTNLQQLERDFINLSSSLTVYLPFDRGTRLLYAFKVGGAHNFGDFDFFQANRLGGEDNLRGYSAERFAGRSSFYFNNEIRWDFYKYSSSNFPFTLGIAPAFDVGRVWWDGETSTKWHTSYGGSFYTAPLDYAALVLNYMLSPEGGRFTVSIGFNI